MENYSFKTAAFGGFDKQDVMRYIEQASEKAAAAQRSLEAENEALRKEIQTLSQRLQDAENESAALLSRCEGFQKTQEEASAARAELEALRPLEAEVSRLRAEAAALRPDAQAYAQFRERLGAIECEARKRADDLETASARQMKKTVDSFRTQYDALMRTFESAAGHVTEELRKIEVSLSQLPRVMDRSGAELEQLTAGLECPPEDAGS